MKIKFKIHISNGIFKEETIELLWGTLLGACSDYHSTNKLVVWCNNKVLKVRHEDVLEVKEE